MNHKCVVFLVTLFYAVSLFAADSSSIMLRSDADARVATQAMNIGQQNGRWFVRTSDMTQPVYLSDEAMAQIVATMPSDQQALVLYGGNWGLLLSHIAEHNLLQHPNDLSLAATSDASASHVTPHTQDYQSIMDRMSSYRNIFPQRVVVRGPSVLALQIRSYKALQKAGDKPALQAEQRRLEAELRKHSTVLYRGHLQRQLAAVKRILAQENTELLHILRTRPSSEGQVALQQIQAKWPYNVYEVDPQELRSIRLHVERIGFNELQAAKHLLMLKRESERPQECLQAADISGLEECKTQLELQRACETDTQKVGQLQRRIDRIQAWLDDEDLPRLQALNEANSIEEAYLIRREIESTPTSTDIIRAMQHIWGQKEGAREFAGLSEAEREARLSEYQAHSAAARVASSVGTVSRREAGEVVAASQLASAFLEKEFGIAPERYLNFTGTADQQKKHAIIRRAIDHQVAHLTQATTIEEQGVWAIALQSNVASFRSNESGDLQSALQPSQMDAVAQSEMVDFATQIVSRLGDNAQHPLAFIREKIENVVDVGCAIADLTIGQALRTPDQQVQRIQEFVESIHSFTSLPWAERKSIFAKAVADVITVGGFASAANAVKNLATSIPHYLPAVTAAFTEGTSELLSALSETLSGASFNGGAGAAQVIASQEVVAESIAQVAGGFAVAVAADDAAALSLPYPTAVLRQDNEKNTGGGDKSVTQVSAEPISHNFENVEHLIENAGKLEKKKHGVRQGWIKGDPEMVFKNLAEKHGAQIRLNDKGVPNFKFDSTSVHLTGSKAGMPTLRIKSQGNLFKIRII